MYPAAPAVVQTGLAVNTPGDRFEREADRVADEVMGTGDRQPRRAAPGKGESSRSGIGLQAPRGNLLQTLRVPGGMAAGPATPPSVGEALRAPGQPLDATTRAYMEPRFGHDFGSVRVHTGARAAESAREVNAHAYTVGRNVVFAAGRYAPASPAGQRLIAHELAHVVQQGAAGADATLMRQPAAPAAPAGPPALDYAGIAARVHAAIWRPGTDEEAVYQALQELGRSQPAIDELKRVYLKAYGVTLLDDINGDFSGEELEYALQLINAGTPGSKQRIEAAPATPRDVTAAARRIWNAVDGPGTDEEDIFAALLPFRQNTLPLQNEYHRLYHEDLRDRLIDEMSGSELEYALQLTETPYQHYIQEANEKLAGVPFGAFGDLSNFCLPEEISTSAGTKFKYWYDREYWESGVGTQPDGRSTCKVKLLSGKSPAAAIDAMFDHQDRWQIACAEFVQIAHLYALRHTLGARRFDERVGGGGFTLEVQRRSSTGIETEITYRREGPADPMVRSSDHRPDPRWVDEILAAAPVGSRVRWTNLAGIGENAPNPWEHENTIKLGPDKFAAHGTATFLSPGNTHTREEVELATAQGSDPRADASYVKKNIFISEIEIFRDPSPRPRGP